MASTAKYLPVYHIEPSVSIWLFTCLFVSMIHHKNNKEKPLNMYTSPSNIQGMRESEKNERGCLLYWSLSPQETFSVVHLVYIGNIIPGELSMNGLESLQPQYMYTDKRRALMDMRFFGRKTNQKIVFGYFSMSLLYPLVF